MSEQRRYAHPKNITDHDGLTILGAPWDSSRPWVCPKMTLRVVNANLRITAYSNNPDEPKSGAVTINFKYAHVAMAFLHLLEDAANNPSFDIVQIPNKDFEYDFKTRQRSDEIRVISKVYVSRSDDGVISIHLEEKNRQRIKYDFLPDQYWAFADKSGTPLPKDECSARVVRAWVAVQKGVIPVAMAATYKEPEPKNRDGGQKKTYNNNGNNSSWDDDSQF